MISIEEKHKVIVGISGASGIIYGIKILQMLKEMEVETHLVITKPGVLTLSYETAYSVSDLKSMADCNYNINDIGAAIASGSFQNMGMIVAPCSIRSLSEIAYGTTSNLLTRAADVTLKERRRLVLMLRETPLHVGHLKSMLQVTEAGAIVSPPTPAFYIHPQNISDIIDYTAGRLLDLFGLHHPLMKRWMGINLNEKEVLVI